MKRDTILTIKLPRGNGLEDYAVREPPLACARIKPLLAVSGCN